MKRAPFKVTLVHLAVLAMCGVLPGCATVPAGRVNVPVPIACQEATPARPAMDTDALSLDAPADIQARAMRAEIERREGYEGELLAALNNCQKPLARPGADSVADGRTLPAGSAGAISGK